MCGRSGVPSTPSQVCPSGAGSRSRFRPFAAIAATGLALLSAWWLPIGSAQAASYPPALGCAVAGTAVSAAPVSGSATPGSSVLTVHGMGFRAGSPVLVSLAGRRTGRTVADSAGSFEAAWPIAAAQPGSSALRAAGPDCWATGPLTVQVSVGRQPLPPSEQSITAVPVARLTGLPPQLFLGVAGAVLLAGAALTGLTGRLGHRAEGRNTVATSAAGLLPDNGQYRDDVPE